MTDKKNLYNPSKSEVIAAEKEAESNWQKALRKEEEKKAEEKVEAPVQPVDDKQAEKQEYLDKALAILRVYNGLESDVPRDSEYWTLMNKYRTLLNP